MNDRYKLNLFYSGKENEPKYLKVNKPCSEIYTVDALRINITSKEIESEWIKVLPIYPI